MAGASSRETDLGLVLEIHASWKSGALVFLNYVPLQKRLQDCSKELLKPMEQ